MFSLPRRRRFLIPLTIILILALAATVGNTNSAFIDPEDTTDNVSRVITDWYDIAYGYRKPITINNTGSTLTDYQVKITVDTETLIGQSKMQSDGDDIRFTSSDGSTGIDYWIESGIDTDSTIIWVEAPSVPNGDSTIYIYYGNSGAGTGSNFGNTFPNTSFQDLFTDSSKVNGTDSSNITVTSGEAQLAISTTESSDQSQTTTGSEYEVHQNNWTAQTFYAGFSGKLTKVALWLSREGTHTYLLNVEIWTVSGDLPDTLISGAQASRNDITTAQEYEFINFTTPPSVTAGTKYAIVIYCNESGSNINKNYHAHYTASDVYSSGRKCDSTTGGSSWTGQTQELYFKTYITTGWDLDQSQTSTDANRAVYDQYQSGQSFQVGMDGKLTRVSLWASASGSPANPLTVEVQDVEEVSGGESIDQSQTTDNGTRKIYGSSWRAQTFQAGVDGDLSRIRLKASKQGSISSNLTVGLYDVVEGFQYNQDQSQTTDNATRKVFEDNLWAQIFQTGAAGDLGRITLKASKQGSISSDLTVQLRDVVEGFQYNEDQSQTTDDGTRKVYQDNLWAQIFQTGAAGDLGRITLKASKQGSISSDLTVELRNVVPSSQDIPDQVQTSQSTSYSVYGNNWLAQTFQAGSTTTVPKVALWVSVAGGPKNPLNVELWTVDGGGLPNTLISGATASRPAGDFTTTGAEYEFTFATAPSVTQGTDYAIVAYQTGTKSGKRYDIFYDSENYGSGSRCTSSDGVPTWSAQSDDLWFKTFIPDPGNVPGSTVHASKSLSTVDSEGDYDFTFDTPYTVGSGEDYAIVVSTGSGNESTDYYTVAYNTAGGYANDRECYSDDGETNWHGSDDTDLYFKTYFKASIGNIPDSVLTSTFRSDIATEGIYDFTFSEPYYAIEEGTDYAIVISATGGDESTNYYTVAYNTAGGYADGAECSSTDGVNWSVISGTDLYFETYANVTSGYQPAGGTPLASVSRSDIGSSAREYEFILSSPIDVEDGDRYAIVVKTTGGDAGNCYNVAYQSTDVYSDGEESLSSDYGSNWTFYGYDLWFKVYVDQPTDGILRSVLIPEDSETRLTAGIELSWNDTEQTNSDILYQLEYYTDPGWSLIPDGVLTGNSTGFDSSPVDISSIFMQADYDEIRLRANLSTTYSTDIPSIQDWMVTYRYREYTLPEPSITGIGGEE
ncbi:DUF2341 domain-containing protein [Chloroflexota bacterium]